MTITTDCTFWQGGFEHHVKVEHNLWTYIYFFIHLKEAHSNDYTTLELYVSTQVSYIAPFISIYVALNIHYSIQSIWIKICE